MTQDELRQLIDQAAREGWTELDLHNQEITELPSEIGQMSSLKSFNISLNKLTAVPPEIGQLSSLKSLDLGGNQLTAVPPEIFQLTSLQSLDLGGNQLTAVPPELGQLTSLQQLWLCFNKLTVIPSEIGQLTNLQLLDLGVNQLIAVPSEIGQLSNLQQLYLHSNRLKSVPQEFAKLTGLQDLYLWGNRLTVMPPEIIKLSSLQSLDLHKNQLTVLPPGITNLSSLQSLDLWGNRLTNVPTEVGQLSRLQLLDLSSNHLIRLPAALRSLEKLEKLNLYGNPLPIPPEILSDIFNPGNPKTILDAYFQASRPLREAKLLLVGEGSVGKTSLVERLLWNRSPSNRGKTIGIDIHPWEVEIEIGDWRSEIGDGGVVNNQGTDNSSRNTDNGLRVNVWDFGGQEIYHATHQFFLTHRSLYLLVIESRKDEAANRLDYWLRHVQSFAGEDAPIILVINKSDQGRLALDERGLRLKYPAIRAIVHTSCTSGDGIPALRQAIEQALAAMPHLNDHLPLTWFAVKEKLAALGKDTLPYESYIELCHAEGISDQAAQRTLARFLHDLGTALNFQDDPRLAGTHVLNPEWVTGGIYTILNAPALQERGLLRLPELDNILDGRRYPVFKHPFLLDIMHKFELSVPLGDGGQQYLIPGLLPKERPAIEWPEIAEIALEYRYAILPAAVLSRLMVRLHSHIWQPERGQPVRWRNGLGVTRDGCRALVIADPAAARLTVALDGPAPHRRHLLAIIRAELDEIHASFAHLEAAEWVPIPGKPGAAILYRALLNLESRGIFSHYDPAHDVEIDVRALLDGIESPDERDIRTLVSQMTAQYNLAELRQLAFELDVNHEDLPHHTTHTELARELALHLRRHGRLPELAAMVKRR
ncbi:MAG TPA: COR domain-containing protein [Chloroflexota bacterium]|nr:COR domain-containing protein [Chloroflexota bacterium]